jgi:hypothetical protein
LFERIPRSLQILTKGVVAHAPGRRDLAVRPLASVSQHRVDRTPKDRRQPFETTENPRSQQGVAASDHECGVRMMITLRERQLANHARRVLISV